MPDRQPLVSRRFEQVWKTVNDDGGQIRQTEGEPTVLLVHQEPYVAGSLRPSVKTLRLISWDMEISLNNLQSTFSGRSEYVQSLLPVLEGIVDSSE